MIYEGVEQLVEDAQKVKGHQRDLLDEGEGESPPTSQTNITDDAGSIMTNMAGEILSTIQQGITVCSIVLLHIT